MTAQRPNPAFRQPAIQGARLLDQLIGETARQSLEPPVLDRLLEMLEGAEPSAGLGGGERLEPPRRPLALRLGPEFADQPDPRGERRPSGDLARRLAAPGDEAAGGKGERLVALARERA